MNKTGLFCWLSACVLLLSSGIACAQAAGPKTGAVSGGVEELMKQEPGSYVSTEAYAEEWAPINERQIEWKRRVWRTMDTKEQGNAVLASTGSGGKSFSSIVIEGVLDGRFKAYVNDVYYKKLSVDSFRTILTSNGYDVASKSSIASITKFLLKEDWLYLDKEQKLLCRLISIAPVKEVIAVDGTVTEVPLFWIYYPEVRKYLKKEKVNDKNGSVALDNLDQFFEMHRYAAPVERTDEGRVRLVLRCSGDGKRGKRYRKLRLCLLQTSLVYFQSGSMLSYRCCYG